MLLLILTICILFSGCIEEKIATQTNESVHQGSANISPENLSSTSLSSKGENIQNIPEIELKSFSSIYMHDNNEKLYDYLFSWANVPGNENQKLISYLQEEKNRNYLEISWGNHAQIIKSDDNKTIRVYFSNSTELMLEDNKNNFLRTPDVELKLREVNGKYRISITPQTLQNDELEGKEVNSKLYIYKTEEKLGYNITESCYAVYGLSIKNNGSKNLDFKLNELHVRDGDHAFNITIEPIYRDSLSEVISDLEKETKLEDTTLAPGQTINGSVVFQVNSLYNKSFLLMYKETPIPSASFEKSIEALNIAERYNYSTVFGVPPYKDIEERSYFKPDSYFKDYYIWDIWANWVNRSVFEVFNKAKSEYFTKELAEDVAKSSMEYTPKTELVYALKVIPARNITVNPNRKYFVKKNGLIVTDSTDSSFKVVDDTGEELINTSRTDKIAILKNQTYEPHYGTIPQMNFSNATIVRISFMSDSCEALSGLASFVNQNVIMDKELNIVVASNKCQQFMA
jgi:hypothetical protein